MVFRSSCKNAFISGVIFRRAGVRVPSTSNRAKVRLVAGMAALACVVLNLEVELSAAARCEAASAVAPVNNRRMAASKLV